MSNYTSEQQAYIIQFQHPEKMLAGLPGFNEPMAAELFGLQMTQYQEIVTTFSERAHQAARELLNEEGFQKAFFRLPLAPGDTIVGLGDSITDDYQSWVEILRHCLSLTRPEAACSVVNAGYSGDTTTQVIARFWDVIHVSPQWIICLIGTNDARLHGLKPEKTLVSLAETAKNLQALRSFARTQTNARWLWMTPPPVIEEQIAQDWFLSPFQMMWRNQDLDALRALILEQPDPVVNLQPVFGFPANPQYLLSDGLHPSIEGQKAMLRSLVARWSEIE